jgi:transposase
MWLWDDLLATPAGLAAGGRVGRVARGDAGQAGASKQDRLAACVGGFGLGGRSTGEKGGGQSVGPSPTDRGKQGTKRHLVVDALGTPLGVVLSGANTHDSKMFEAAIDAIPDVRSGRRGRPRFRPEKVHADKGYDFAFCRAILKQRGIIARIARRGIESSERLGKHRWVVERTHSWMNRYRRLKVRYEKRADIHLAFVLIACAMICLKQLHRFC